MQESRDPFAEEMVEAIYRVSGRHAGFRAAHARGICASGTFTATPAMAGLTRAAHFQRAPVPVTVRYSNGSGDPSVPDWNREGRGMATKFHLPDGGATDLVAITLPTFAVRTPEDFLAFTFALTPDPATGQPDMAKLQAFLATHPETARWLPTARGLPPAGYARARYFAIHAFKFVAPDGRERFVRYRWEPEDGVATLTDEEAQAKGDNYLAEEFRSRLAGGPAAFTLYLQLAGPGDDPSDPTTAWPEERETVPAGRLELTAVVADQEGGCQRQVFDPANVTAGIELSEDPILRFRPRAYSVSIERRLGAG
jgi:catalase